MSHYSKIKDLAELLTYSHKGCEPFYQEVVNFNLAESSVLDRLLNSVVVPAWLLITRFTHFWKFYEQEISTDHEYTQLNDLAQGF